MRIVVPVLLLALTASPVAAQYPGMMGGRMDGGSERAPRAPRERLPDLPTEVEIAGPPDLQTLVLAADIDTTGLSAYGKAFAAYRDSTRPGRDSIWVALQQLRPGGDPAEGAERRRTALGLVQRLWPPLQERDERFVKEVLKAALPKKAFKGWEKARDDEVKQARKDREQEWGGEGSRR